MEDSREQILEKIKMYLQNAQSSVDSAEMKAEGLEMDDVSREPAAAPASEGITELDLDQLSLQKLKDMYDNNERTIEVGKEDELARVIDEKARGYFHDIDAPFGVLNDSRKMGRVLHDDKMIHEYMKGGRPKSKYFGDYGKEFKPEEYSDETDRYLKRRGFKVLEQMK